jgi:hypothetical protein
MEWQYISRWQLYKMLKNAKLNGNLIVGTGSTYMRFRY